MRIYLMQHGTCLPKELAPEQPLSPVGREQIEKTAAIMKNLGLEFDIIACSPKLRSRQSARIAAHATSYPEKNILVTDAAKPMADPQKLIQQIRGYGSTDSVLIAGHLPSLNGVASSLLLEPGPPTLHFHMENGGLTCISTESEHRRGTLEWHLTPKFIGLMN
ncbi:SixA phosphatase family protein [Pseudodesulfovibrio senegalensis]|uniref:Histidine phosphatase family protein n=1 Tax=Pseudodesulfovibrio senegalensis TaxID=1721087 RepID=A0A6N6N115_9BACT|nr:histidine phosphatase family protein [Pseudodesulfovibrio senegalensis]KAB1441184.1 histidine phosphatase family protein [Pseudodesulfovibrio senegalensis]